MAETSSIEWTDSTFNPWIGCTKISPACDHCYAEALMDTRHHRVTWGGERSRTSASNWQQPRRWQNQADAFFVEHGRSRRVFCSSLADVFDNQVPEEWRADLWELIGDTPGLDWQLLTKRPQNIAKMLPAFWDEVKGHVWLGTTIEDQQRADLNIPHLLLHRAAQHFVSYEPALGPVDWKRWLPTARQAFRPGGEPFLAPHFFMTKCEHCGWAGSSELVHLDQGWDDADCICPNCNRSFLCDETPALSWVIGGGESGPQARPSHPDWFRSLRDQCSAAGVPFLFKQWGEWKPGTFEISVPIPENGFCRTAVFDGESWRLGQISHDAYHEGLFNEPDVWRIGKKAAGRLLDGIEHNGFPTVSP